MHSVFISYPAKNNHISGVAQIESSGVFHVLVVIMQIFTVPIDDCSSNTNTDCSSCVSSGNPLCGWCVVESRCSRQFHCQNGSSNSSARWIPTNIPSADAVTGTGNDTSARCIANTITPNQFLASSRQPVSLKPEPPYIICTE